MALFVPAVVGGATVGAAAYQAWNPPAKQSGDALNGAPRNLRDWRLEPQEDIRRLSQYWRNSVNRPVQPIEDAYRHVVRYSVSNSLPSDRPTTTFTPTALS
jgi:hypothetical protein